MMPKNFQIPKEIFLLLIHYFLLEDPKPGDFEKIQTFLNEKLDKIAKREYYSQQFDENLTPSQREEARQKYLNLIGMNDNFRY